jgi:hypothetical protein
MPVPKKVSSRLVDGIKRYQPILSQAKARDVGEADTVTIIKDVLADVFGYDKYSEVTSEHAIRGTYCDLALKLDGSVACLIEVKAIGLELKDQHTKQAVDYAANQGCEWVLLTNGMIWKVYHVTFTRPINADMVLEVDFSSLNPKNESDLETLFLMCKEGFQRSALGEFNSQRQALSRFFLGNMILTDPVLEVIRRELRRVSPDVKIDIEQIRSVLVNEVLKREVLEGDQATEAKKRINRAANKALRQKAAKDDGNNSTQAEEPVGESAGEPETTVQDEGGEG